MIFKMENNFYEDLKKKVKKFLEEGEGHGFDHTERVFNNSVALCENENADIDIVKTSALLHDIARPKERSGKVKDHADKGSEMAREILKKTNFPENKIKDVCYAIKVHRFSKGIKPKTKEAMILQDADRLDALGAVILVRMIQHATKENKPIYDSNIPPEEKYGNSSTLFNHLDEKIFKIKPETFHTEKARELANGRYEFIKEFAKRYLKEIKGEL